MTEQELQKATPKKLYTWLDTLEYSPAAFSQVLSLLRFCFGGYYHTAALQKQKDANRALRERNTRLKHELRSTR